ncbi:hypothetical protein [Erwinia rhapontici]|uniref:hypothetical protein n=1 Tax=Erwinia rhapontici TaxID=55212 RepID=UPI003D360D9B
MTNRFTKELSNLASDCHDYCMSCGYVFNYGDTSHSGYDNENEPLYVCDNCSGKLKETASRSFYSPLAYEVPEKNTKLWRYMDFTKYVSLLSSKGVYFSRANCFEDDFEGAKGIKKNKVGWDTHFLNYFRDAIINLPDGVKSDKTSEEIEQNAQRLLKELEMGGEVFRSSTFISCWHENNHESEAMWRLYSRIWDNAIAIRTTYQSLKLSLGSNPMIKIGRVKYIDMNKGYAGVNDAFWRKRKSFEHEREVRALTMDFDMKDAGKIIPCDLSVLIEEVFVSPKAPGWFISLVNDINKKYSINIQVSPSELDEVPFF